MLPELEKQASDPKTPLKQLQYIAQNYPQLRPAIAANPSTYPALLDWLSEFHEPSIDRALEERLEREKARAEGNTAPIANKKDLAKDSDFAVQRAAKETQSTAAKKTPLASGTSSTHQSSNTDSQFGVTLPDEEPAGIVDRSRRAFPVRATSAAGALSAAGAIGGTGAAEAETTPANALDANKGSGQAKAVVDKGATTASSGANNAGIAGAAASASKELDPALTKANNQAIDGDENETDSRGRRRRAAVATAGAAGAATASTAAASAHDSSASTTKASGALTKLQRKKKSEPNDDDFDDEDGGDDDKHSVWSRIALWIVGIIIILALIAVGIAVAVFTNSWPMGSDNSHNDAYQTIQPDSKEADKTPDAQKGDKEKDPDEGDDKDGEKSSTVKAPKKGTSLSDASSGDANGNGVPDAKEQGSKGVSLDFQNQDRLIVPPPEDQSMKRPVPDGAVTNLTKFGSSDGNVQCAIGAGGVQCALNKPASTLDIGNNGLPIQITFNQKLETEVIALANPVAKTAEANLAAGAAVTQGQFVCEGTSGKGVNCWDTKSGHGFTMEPTQLVRY